MPSETATSKVSLSTKPTESRWLAVADLPETATEDTIKECFKRHGRVLSVKIDDQRFAFIAFLDIRIASKAHNAENILDEQRLRTAFHDGSNSVPKALVDPPLLTSQPSSSSSIVLPEQPSLLTSLAVIDPSSSSSNTSNISAVTNSLSTKIINGDRDKRSSRAVGSPDENVRHQVVPVKRDSDSSGSKRKTSSTNISKTANNSHTTIQKPPRRKHDNSSSSSSSSTSSYSERSSDDSISCKNRRRNPTKTHSSLNDPMGKSKILKIFHLPSKTPKESLRESIWNLFVDFKKSCRLLTVKIDGEHEARHALLTFRKAEDVDKALAFVITKSINGVKLKAEPYEGITNENDECDVMKRFICSDLDHDEYSIKATRTLYIGNLQSEISYNELREAYSAHGDIIELEIKRQTQTQHQLPFAFVQYADIKSVVKAMKAFESKLVRDHSIKLGFGKSQPTNVLWLDELPLNVTESSIRNFILCQTSLSPEQVLDIYIDNRNSHKSSTAQCLIYFLDTRAAQQAINLIRGKKIDSKKIQVDFASKVFVTRFSDIIEETSHKKNYPGYPSETNYHGESRPISKRNGTARETIPETNQTFDPSSTRTNSSDRWSNAYNNSIRSQHKSDQRHSSDRRHSKEYGKGTSTSLAATPSADNGTIPGSALSARRNRLSTSSKDSVSNNISSGRNPHRSSHSRHHASSTSSSSSSRSSSPSSTHSSASTTSLEHRSTSYQKHSNNKHSQKTSKKPPKVLVNNVKPSSGKKSSSNKEHSNKSSNRSRSNKSEKDNDSSTIIPSLQQQQKQPPPPLPLPDPVILTTISLEDQLESIKKEPSPSPKQQTTIHSSTSPKAPLKNTERVFDWLMQNHHDSNSSMGLDQNDDDEHLLKRKPDEDSLENVSDEQTSKASPPSQTNNSTGLTNAKSSSASIKNSKNEKASLASAYRLQPIRTGNKRDDQMDSSSVNEVHLSPPQSASIMTPTLPTPTIKEDQENIISHRPVNKTKYNLATNQTKAIPLDSVSSYDQLDVRLKSYPSLFNDHVESIRLPFPQFAFEYIKTSTTSSNVLVVLNPKAHLKHSSLGLNNLSSTSLSTLPAPSATTIAKYDISADVILPTTIDEDLSTTRIPLDERIRLLDKQMYEMNQGQQKSTASSSSSSSSSSLSPATLIEQQNQKTIVLAPASTVTNTIAKNVTERVSTLSAPTPSPTLAQCIQAARNAALNAQPIQSMSPSKTAPTISATSSFPFPGTSVPSLTLNRTISAVSPSPVNISSVLTPPPPPFPTLQRLPDATSNSLLTSFHAAIAQTQIAAVAAAKYNPMTFATTIHPPPPPVPASLISPSLSMNSSPITPMVNVSSNNNPISTMNCPPSSPSLPNRSIPTNLSSPPVSHVSSYPETSINSPSTSSAKILERLGPSAKFKRKPIPPPLAVITTSITPTSMKDSPVLPSPEATTPTHTGTNLHRSPATVSPPVLQNQLSTSSSSPTTSGLKSILKQRSLSNPSSLSPTNERKTSTSYVSPLASNETRPVSQVTSMNHRSTSIDTTPKRTPPVTTEKKKSLNSQDNQVYTNDIDERHADEKKSAWRTPPTKQPSSNDSNNTKKPLLDKIPKKASATPNTPKSTVVEPAKSTSKVTKPIKQTPLGTKVPQLTLERLDAKSLKSANEPAGKSNNKSIKLKRANVIQSDSDTDKRSTVTSVGDVQKAKKTLLNNEITKRKQQHQQKSVTTKNNELGKSKTKTAIRTIRKPSVAETHSSVSDMDDKQLEQATTSTHSEEEQTSSDTDDTSQKGSGVKRTKMTKKNKMKSTSGLMNFRELRPDTSMYDRIKKRARIEQTRNSSSSTSEGHLSGENSDEDDNDNDDDRMSSRPNNVAPKRHTIMSESSDSEEDLSSKTKTKKPTVFDNNVFDAEESDEKTKPSSLPKKTAPSQTKKSILKTDNDQTGKEKVSKPNDESVVTKKKITITKSVDKKKPVLNTTKPTSKIPKTTITAQKRPSTDELNESTKKLKVDDEKSKTTIVDEQIPRTTPTHSESEVSTSTKPAIVITSPSTEPSTSLSKTDKPSTGSNTQTTPTKFGIVFPSHHRHSTGTPTSMRKQSTETSASHETSKNEDDEIDDDTELVSNINNNDTASKEGQLSSSINTLKPPTVSAHPPLSDDETLNPETMQLSDLIGGSRREGTKPVQSRSSTKGTGKGKRVTKQDTNSNKRQQTKTNTKTVIPAVSNEKDSEASTDLNVLPTAEQPTPVLTTAKRLSTVESPSVSSPVNDKEAKRLRRNTDELTPPSQIKLEPTENPSKWIGAQVKEETVEPVLPSETHRQEILAPPSTVDQPQITAMETDQIPPASSLVTSTNSPLATTTSAETDNAIKALCSSIQIPQPSVSKTPNLEKSSPIIAPISKETLPIVEHQPTSITTASIVPSHVPIKSSLTSTTFNENVEETLSAVNSLLMLNSNPSNISGDHPAMKGAARVTPTISKPVYSLVTSLPSPTDKQSRPTAVTTTTTTTITPSSTTATSVSTSTTQSTDLITMVSNIVSSSNLGHEKQPVPVPTTTPTTMRSHIEEVIDDVAKGASTTTTTTTGSVVTEPITSMVDTNALSTSTATTKSTPLPHILRDVMKTPCLTSSTSTPTTTGASETLNLFDGHRRSTSPLKTTAPTITTTPNVSTTTTSAAPVVPVAVRPTASKTSTPHKRSTTPKVDPPPPARSPMMHPFSHMLTPDGGLYAAAAAAHQNFPFALFNPLTSNPGTASGNPSANLLAPSRTSNSPPVLTRTPSTNAGSPLINHPFLNTIMTGQQNSSSTNLNQHNHDKGSRRDASAKGSGTSSTSSSSRSTPIQQTVPVQIALTIPSSSSSSNPTTSNVISQQQGSPLIPPLDPATVAAVAMRQQASPLQPFLGPESVVPFRNVYADPSDLYGAPAGLYQSQNIAYAAAQQMLNVMGMTGSHHPSAAAFAELYSSPDSYYRLNAPTNELSRDPYNVQWQGNLILKNDQAYVKTQLVAGSPQIARASMNYWNSDSGSAGASNLQSSPQHNLRISQRMRLEQAQLEGVQKRMQMDNDHCILIAEPNGSTPEEIRTQQNNLKNGVIRYFDEKKAAGIVNVLLPGASQPSYVVHIFPPCQFASEILQKRAPDTYRCVVQNKIEQIYLLIVITSTVQ